jgi:hypothetical protein
VTGSVSGSVSDEAGQVERLRRLFRLFAATQCRGRSPVYEALSDAIADHDEPLRLLLAAPVEQRRPTLLLAAVNLLLAAQPGGALAAYYPTHGGQRPADAQLWPAFTAFCAAHREELTGLLGQRSTQTNEIRRCVALRLGLARGVHLARAHRRPGHPARRRRPIRGAPWPRRGPRRRHHRHRPAAGRPPR